MKVSWSNLNNGQLWQIWQNGQVLAGLYLLSLVLIWRLPLWFGRPLLVFADQSVYLAMGKLLLQGQVPYLDFFDFNPPLIMYLSMVPNLAADWLSLPLPLVFNLFVWLTLLVSLAVSALLMLANLKHPYAASFLPLLLALSIFSQVQHYDWGQREHFFVLFYFPYLLCRLLRSTQGSVSRPLALICGFSGALGICLKPQFMLTALAVEVCFYSKNWFSLEVKTIVAVSCAYFAHFLFYPAPALQILFEQVLPVYSLGKGYFANTFIHGLSSSYIFSYPFYLLALALVPALALEKHCRWLRPIIVFTTLSMLSFINAGTIWTYRGLPMQAGAFLLLALSLSFLSLPSLSSLRSLALSLACILASLFLWGQWGEFRRVRLADVQIPLSMLGQGGVFEGIADSPAADIGPIAFHILGHSKPDQSVLYMGVGVRPAYPALLLTRRRPGSRYLYGMVLPMVGEARRFDKSLGALEATIIANYGRDIGLRKPALIYVEDFYVAPLLKAYDFQKLYMRS